MTIRRLLYLTVFCLAFAARPLAAAPILPPWFPESLFTINPDTLTVEVFGKDEFKIGKGGDDYDTVEREGRHWAGSLYPPGPVPGWDNWNNDAVWNVLQPKLEKEGFKIVYLHHEPGRIVDGTFRKGTGANATYAEVVLGSDAYSNSVAIIEPAALTRALTLKAPAPQPETFSDAQDFPYLTPLAGAKLLNTSHDIVPLDVTTSGDRDLHLVGSGTITKMYEGPAEVSPLDFTSTYETALGNAGWTVVGKSRGALTAHYAKNGRDLWTHLYQEGGGGDRWDIVVADVGSSLRAALDIQCKVALYGINFDFNRATLRPDSEPVLQQVLGLMRSMASTGFEIGGHTDNVGTPAYNQKLSEERAAAVKAWLVTHGIAAGRLTTRGYGDSAPIAPNDSDANRARNRRVELKKANC